MDGVEYDELKMCLEDIWFELNIISITLPSVAKRMRELQDQYPFLQYVCEENYYEKIN